MITPEQVRAKHILISVKDESVRQESENKAKDILNKIKAGEDFDKLMNQNSEDPGLKTNPTGYTFGKGQMVKEFEDTAFSLKVGEVSDLVKTSYGYHIIKVEEKFPQKQQTFDEVKTQIKNAVENKKKTDYLQGLLEKWETESEIINLME
jgi:foldase protein PrsA